MVALSLVVAQMTQISNLLLEDRSLVEVQDQLITPIIFHLHPAFLVITCYLGKEVLHLKSSMSMKHQNGQRPRLELNYRTHSNETNFMTLRKEPWSQQNSCVQKPYNKQE